MQGWNIPRTRRGAVPLAATCTRMRCERAKADAYTCTSPRRSELDILGKQINRHLANLVRYETRNSSKRNEALAADSHSFLDVRFICSPSTRRGYTSGSNVRNLGEFWEFQWKILAIRARSQLLFANILHPNAQQKDTWRKYYSKN